MDVECYFKRKRHLKNKGKKIIASGNGACGVVPHEVEREHCRQICNAALEKSRNIAKDVILNQCYLLKDHMQDIEGEEAADLLARIDDIVTKMHRQGVG